MDLEDLIKNISGDLEKLITTKTVIGDPIQAGNKTIVPITKVSFGFGGGGSTDANKKETASDFGGGGGAGAKLDPIGFLVVSDEEVRLLRISEKTDLGILIENAPEIMERLKRKKTNQKEKKEDQSSVDEH
ncbi:GerW family sporulation protein [Methanosalsum natronophilum]|uniref:Sporulation protein n=1 Tax=Methanosalsum natronophilum TaxID=768733 RepID=A0A3R7XU08_9EURY|nr:spore germination protein GerW family protein [Methanosalsum natronophilum]MCS3924399.1 sporulation protein YtfJ [Methanosalsum natronophilum]RQD84162.1 MAG: sporulation protein [Methanosalsum natronophilum]